MTARIFIHPRCVPFTPAQGALYATLDPVCDLNKMVFFQHLRGERAPVFELVKVVGGNPLGYAMYERCDGVRFAHTAGQPASPEAA